MDAAVAEEPLERSASDLATHGIECAQHDRFRCVVDDRLTLGLELHLTPAQALFVALQLAHAALEALLTLVGPLLEPCHLGAPLPGFRLDLVAPAGGLLLRREQDRLGLLLGAAQGV